MRIAYIVKRYPRYSETFVVNEILAHEEAGLDITIFALRPCLDTHFQDILARVRAPVYTIPYRKVRADDFWKAINNATAYESEIFSRIERLKNEDTADIYQALLLIPRLFESNIEHIHAHFANVAAKVARCVHLLTGITYSITAHAKDIFHESVNAEKLKVLLQDAKNVVTVSDYNVKFLLNQFPDLNEKIVRIFNGLDLDKFAFNNSIEAEPFVLSVGRLVEKKGFVYLVQAMSILKKRGIKLRCEIIGSGELESEILDAIDRYDVADCVSLLGPRPQAEVKNKIMESILFAAPCVVGNDGNRDGLPTVLLESMALGTPCISTDVTGIPEAIKDNKTGLIVSQHSSEELADAIEKMLDSKKTRERLALRARELIEQQFNVRESAKKLREKVFPAY